MGGKFYLGMMTVHSLRVKRKKRHGNRSVAGTCGIFVFLLILGMFMMLPLLYAIVSSLKPLDELYIYPPRFFVNRPTFDNIKQLFTLAANLWVPFSRYVFNSLFVGVVATVGHIIIASMCAFAFSKYNIRIKWMFNVIQTALLFNGTVLWLPQYVIMAKLGLLNTYWGYIFPILPMPLGLFLMKQFMDQLPTTLIEAAEIDGATAFTIFRKIVMSTVKPAWLTLMVFAFQSVWNSNPQGVVFDEQLKLLQSAISEIVSSGISRVGVSMAGSLFIMIPPILIFVFSQNSVIETMAHSGIKD